MALVTLLPTQRTIRSGAFRRLPTAIALRLEPIGSQAVPVPGLDRRIHVQLAASRADWEGAFQLVADNYQARGYDGQGDYHFTPYHALPDTATFVAKEGERVVAAMSLIPDNTLLGLPLESLYAAEVRELRRVGRRLGEVTSLAADGLTLREFTPVFHALIRLMKQYHVAHGGDTWVITVNPRHSAYYGRLLGYAPLGPRRAYPLVQGHPAEAYYLDQSMMRAKVPAMYRRMFADRLPAAVLRQPPLPADLARWFGARSTQTKPAFVAEIARYVEESGSPRRW